MRIRIKVNLVLIVGALIAILSSGGIIGYVSISLTKNYTKQYIARVNNTKAHGIRTFLQGKQEIILSLATSAAFKDFLKDGDNKDETDREIANYARSLEHMFELFILDKNGKIVASSNPLSIGSNKSSDQYFIKGKESVHIKSFYFSETVKANVYAVSAPIIDNESKELLGVIVIGLYPDDLYEVIGSEIVATKTGENFLIDSNYFVISPGRYLTKNDILTKKIETENAKDCFSEKEKEMIKTEQESTIYLPTKQYFDYRGIEIIGTHHYIPEADWCLITKENLSEVLAPSYSLLIFSAIVSLIIFLVFIINFLYASSMIRDILAIKKAMQLVESGDFSQKITVKSKDELEDLSKSFGRMVEAVKKSRAEVDKRVKEQTEEILSKQKDLEDQQKATLNILEDIEKEQENIAIAEAKNRALLENIGEGVVAVDKSGKVIFMNRMAEQILDCCFDEKIIGKPLSEIWKVSDEKGDIVPEEKRPITVALKGKSYTDNSSYYYNLKDGTRIPVAITVSPVIVNGKIIGAIDVFRDITKEKNMEKSRVDFLSLASHQLRTPLSGTKWLIETLQGDVLGKLSKKQKDYIGQLYQLNERMIQLVSEMLGVLRLESETGAIKTESVSVSSIDDDITASMAAPAKSKGIILKSALRSRKIGEVETNREVLKTVLESFISNAINYSKPGQEVLVDLKKEKDALVFFVKDHGIGIPKKEQKQIFGKFYRASNAKEFKPGGSGLGLNIAKILAGRIGAEITFKSEENKGTTFYFRIPVAIKNQKI